MKSNHKEEYNETGTCSGWTEERASAKANWSIKLMFKDVYGNASLIEQVAIEVASLLSYNNITHISEEEIMETAQDIIDLIKDK